MPSAVPTSVPTLIIDDIITTKGPKKGKGSTNGPNKGGIGTNGSKKGGTNSPTNGGIFS